MKPLVPDCFFATINEISLLEDGGNPEWTVASGLPVIPHMAQLSALALVLGEAFNQEVKIALGEAKVSTIKQQLGLINRRAKELWTEAVQSKTEKERDKKLTDPAEISGPISVMRDYWQAEFPQFRGQMQLSAFTNSVQTSLAELNGLIGQRVENALGTYSGAERAGIPPGAIMPAIGLMRLAGAMAEESRPPQENGLLIAAIFAGLGAAEVDGEALEQANIANINVRRTELLEEMRQDFKSLSKHLPE